MHSFQSVEETLSSIQHLLTQTKRLFVIINDDVESILSISENIGIFEKLLLPNVKIVMTVTKASKDLFTKLPKEKCISLEISCTDEQWKDIVENGNSEICPLGHIKLPEQVYNMDDKSLVKAKVWKGFIILGIVLTCPFR